MNSKYVHKSSSLLITLGFWACFSRMLPQLLWNHPGCLLAPKCHAPCYSPSSGPGIRLRWFPSSYQGYARLHTPLARHCQCHCSSAPLEALLAALGLPLGFPNLMSWHIVHWSMSHPVQVGQLGPVRCPSNGNKPCALHILHWPILLFLALTPLPRFDAPAVFLAGAPGAVFRVSLPRIEFRIPETPASCLLVGACLLLRCCQPRLHLGDIVHICL